MFHWLLWIAGLTDPSGAPYLFWSGIGADALRVAIVYGIAKTTRQAVQHHKETIAQRDRHHEAQKETTT